MKDRLRSLVASIVAVLVCSSTLFAVDGKKAQYVGGTTDVPEKSEGVFATTSEEALIFSFSSTKKVEGSLAVRYKSITAIEYGQHAGRRVAVAILVTPWALFSKKRNHFLTLNYTDQAQKEQAAIFELGKDIIRTTLEIVKVRSGKPIMCQDAEAQKDYGGCIVMAPVKKAGGE